MSYPDLADEVNLDPLARGYSNRINLASPTDEGLVDALMNGPLSGTSVKAKISAAGEQDITRAQELRAEGKRLPSPIRAQHIIDI